MPHSPVTPSNSRSLFLAALTLLLLGNFLSFGAAAGLTAETTAIITELIRPARLATLRARGANPRLQKCVYWLATAQRERANLTNLLDTAIASAGYTNALAAQVTRDSLLRNLDIATKLGCLDPDGLSEMRKGNSPTVRRGPYAGQELSVDHIIPRAVCVELDNVIANLELMPQRLNSSKGATVGDRQIALAQTLQRSGLLSVECAEKIHTSALKYGR